MVLGLLITFVITLLSCLYWRFISSKRYKFAEEIGGPPAYPLIGNAYSFIGRTTLEAMLHLNDYSKKVLRLWMGNRLIIVVKAPELYEVVLNSKVVKDKGDFYKILRPVLGEALVTSDYEHWHKMRKILSPAVNGLKIRSFTPFFAKECEKLRDFWQNKTDIKFKPFADVSRTTFFTALRIAIGDEDFNKYSSSEIDHFITGIKRSMDSIGYRFVRPWFYNDFLWSLTSNGRQMMKDTKVFWDILEDMIETKKKTTSDSDTSFLRFLIDGSKNETNYSNINLRDELATFLIAGFETTSAADTFILAMLGCHPELQEKVFEEQEKIFYDNFLRHPENDDIAQMKYLEQFIKETLRLYPSLPIFGQQARDDFKLAQHTIPKGSLVLVAPYIIHRDPALFKNPEIFDPEHFSPEQEKTRHPWSFIPFGAGPRSCIGQKYAMHSIKVFMSTIVRSYIVKTDYKQQDIHPEMDMALKAEDYSITLRKRPLHK